MPSRLETDTIYRGENLDWMREFSAEQVDLAYLDPPFFSNRQYEVIWGEEAEVRSFEDRWAGGINVYVEWMKERMIEIHRILKPTGTMWLHCDPNASHYLKVVLDGIFGREQFLGEVIWKRTSAHSSARRPGPIHDTLLVYTKSQRYTWNRLHQAYDPTYLDAFYTHKDADDRRWRRSDLTGAGTRQGATGLPWRGIDVTAKGRHWAYPPDALDAKDAAGEIHWPKKPGGMPMFKRYADTMPGVPLQDVWTDIPPIHNMSRERIGYPTQKPLDLLRRIIKVSSNKGDVVFDAFCGCGTSVVAAALEKRRWAGIDISPTACRLIKERLATIRVGARIRDLRDTEEALHELRPFEFQNWVIQQMQGTHAPRKTGDMGIDGYTFFLREPIQVKQSSRVGRNVVDNFETAVARSGKRVGYVVAFSFTKGAVEETARVRAEGDLDIRLVRVSDLINERAWQAEKPPVPAPALPRAPTPDAMPTSAELIASERATAATQPVADRIRDDYAARASEDDLGEVAEPSPEAPRSPATSKHGRSRQRP